MLNLQISPTCIHMWTHVYTCVETKLATPVLISNSGSVMQILSVQVL